MPTNPWSTERPACAYCLSGALWACYGSPAGFNQTCPSPALRDARAKVQDYLKSKGVTAYEQIEAWNDNPKRTHAEVLELLVKLDL